MAWSWSTSAVSTIKIEDADNNSKMFSVDGCNNSNSVQPEQAASFINILLGIGGKAGAVSSKMKRTSTDDAISS